MIIDKTWSDFKTVVENKGLAMQYSESSIKYELFAVEGSVTYTASIAKESPASSDQTDFETNYKPTANQPITAGEDQVFTNLAIRDTAQKISSSSDCRGFIPKTIIIDNGLNQTVSIQLTGARDSGFVKEVNIGNAVNVLGSSLNYITMSDYFPYLRLKATCTVAPTTGNLNAYLQRVRA